MCLISYKILFTQSFFFQEIQCVAVYMMSVKLIWQKAEKKIIFIIRTEEDVHNCVSFSPEKRDLLVNISKESSEHIGIEIKTFKPSTESNDLQLTDFTKIKKRSWNSNHDFLT